MIKSFLIHILYQARCKNLIRHRLETPVTTSEQRHEISNNVVCVTSKDSDQPAHTRSLIRAFASRLIILCVLSY